MELSKILFFDIETVAGCGDYDQLDERLRGLWERKCGQIAKGELEGLEPAEIYQKRAGIYAEFGKVVCISVGLLAPAGDGNDRQIRIKSFCGKDEKKVLEELTSLLARHYSDPRSFFLCGHNVRSFDIPYLCRRMLINEVEIPSIMDSYGKKPWEMAHIVDTLEMWKFGDFRNYTSLDLLSAVLGIPSPKDAMDGSMVSDAYWKEDALDDIRKYCEKDVATTIRVFMALRSLPAISDENIIFAE